MRGKIAKWFALQVAGKAVGLALGLPAVSGAVMAILAFADSLPLAQGFLYVVLSMAGTAALLNQTRPFLLAHSSANKVHSGSFEATYGNVPGLGDGYVIGVVIKNIADVPMQYEIRQAVAHIENTILRTAPGVTSGDTIEPRGERVFVFGIAVMPLKAMASMNAEVEFTLAHGPPGKVRHEYRRAYGLNYVTAPNGLPALYLPSRNPSGPVRLV